jgi:hypothetical protein
MAAALAILATAVVAGSAGDAAPSSVPEPGGAVPPASGLRAVVDPATGELVEGDGAAPAEAPHLGELAEALSTSHEGLIEEHLGGDLGVMVDLRGRFQSVVFATVDADGRLQVGHALPAALAKPAPVDVGGEGSDRERGGDHAVR